MLTSTVQYERYSFNFYKHLWNYRVSQFDFLGLVMSSKKKEYFDFLIWMEETCDRAAKEVSERTGKQVTTSTLILDFEHLSMKKLTSKIGNAARS